MNIYKGRSESYFPPQFRYVGFALVIAGVIMLLSMNLFGIGFILIGPMLFLLKTGIRINFSTRCFQEYRGVFNLYYGKWIVLPEIEYVSVYKETLPHGSGGQTIDADDSNTHYYTDLIFPEPNRLRVISFPDKTAAMAVGKLLAENLQSRLLDFTSGEPVWVDEIAVP
jgi:hypothetical protein